MFKKTNTDLAGIDFYFSWLWHLLGWTLIMLVVYLSLTSRPPDILEFAFSDKLKHMLAYGVLMGWFTQLYSAGRLQRVWALTFFLLGVAMEFMQGWSGYRFFDVADMAANSLGVLLGWWLSHKWLAGSLLRVDRGLSQLLGKT